MAKITIYTTRACPYCHYAKHVLAGKKAEFTEIDVGGDPALRAKMTELAGGRTSVPQIFIDDLHVGGCDDLVALDQAGKLDPLLAGAQGGAP